ncbi:gas vesicle protein K [Streptomyces sp. NPDC004838]
MSHESGRYDDSPRPGGPDRPASSRQRWEEVTDAAERAFRLLPNTQPTADRASHAPARRISADPKTVEQDLVRLVLTLVELLRQLMERQALHRVDEGDLSEEQEERLGMTLMLLHDRMAELCAQHGLTMDDLQLDLGPLGPLLPPER